jgi:UDPglucose--hexose-1-phosphate uridylyltransferase
MFEIRKDFLTGMTVLMADGRSERPQFFKNFACAEINSESCPFCPANRHELKDIIHRSNDGRILTILNKYPAIDLVIGKHYVVIDTDKHNESFADYSVSNIARSMCELFRLYGEIINTDGLKSTAIFKNDGSGSGASIQHSHWQVLGLPFISPKVELIHKNLQQFYSEHGISYIESLQKEEERIIYKDNISFVYMPFASLCAQINIAPVRHVFDPFKLTEDEITSLAFCIKSALNSLFKLFGPLPYNICFQAKPIGNYSSSHFFIEIMPRLGNFAGMEMGSNLMINSYFPEVYAKKLAALWPKGCRQ